MNLVQEQDTFLLIIISIIYWLSVLKNDFVYRYVSNNINSNILQFRHESVRTENNGR